MIDSLVRAHLRNFKPYKSARSLYRSGVFLDANENSLGSTITLPLEGELNRYPDPYSTDLREAIGKYAGVPANRVFTGNGSDEVIDLLIRLFVEPSEEILIVEPTYGMYRTSANVAGVGVGSFSLSPDFILDVDGLLARLQKTTKMLFVCSPNNPTGKLISFSDIERICREFSGIVVLDEAYIEFSSRPSAVQIAGNIENLVILRTFSKAWGLAGIRVGYAIANEKIVQYLDKIKPPYNLNRVSAKIALEALRQPKKMTEMRDAILKERSRLERDLARLGFEVFPSEANFLLVRRASASELARKLAEISGIIIRDFDSQPLLADCVRITVGTREQNDALIESLSKLI